MSAEPPAPRFFRDAAALRRWFTAHHATQAAPLAWTDFQFRPASYRKAAMWWIVSAKREATGLRRLRMLIDCSARGEAIPPFGDR